MVATVITKVLSLKSMTVLIAVMAASTIDTLPALAGPERLAHVLASKVTRPPAGWVEFCVRQPGECASTTTAPRDLALSPEAWKDLVRVNKWVNETIKPLTDLEHWGVVERWSYPDDGYGDCEDYVLLKRRMLIQSGWPREALLVTVVRDKKQEGHAVLTVTTDRAITSSTIRPRTSCSDPRLATVSSSANGSPIPMCGSRWTICGRRLPRRPHAERHDLATSV
jgi:predicted transglutaminase-like cysteine proteinase